MDQDLTMKTHVQQTASRCFAIFRQLRSNSSLHTDVRLQFPCVCTRPQQVGLLQQSSEILPLTHIQHLQSVQNAASRLIFNLSRRSDHITEARISLHGSAYWSELYSR